MGNHRPLFSAFCMAVCCQLHNSISGSPAAETTTQGPAVSASAATGKRNRIGWYGFQYCLCTSEKDIQASGSVYMKNFTVTCRWHEWS